MADTAHITDSYNLEYYVYVYWRSDLSRETPFYVGKGKGSRVHSKVSRNADFVQILSDLDDAGLQARIEVSEFMTEADAFALEIDLIDFYGRVDHGDGPLVNHTRGGDGLKSVSILPEMRRKAAKQMAALKARPEVEALRLKNLRAAAKRETTKQKRSKSLARHFDQDGARQRHGDIMKQAWERGDYREAHAAKISASWENDDRRSRTIAGIKVSLANGGAERRSETMKKRFQGPEGEARRAKVAAASAARWADPEYRERMRKCNQKAWDADTGERRERVRKALSEFHSSGAMKMSRSKKR